MVVSVGECPSCHTTLVGVQDEFEDQENGTWLTEAERVWPRPKRTPHWSIPAIVRVSLEEADRCFQAGAFTACGVMCGRAIEGVSKHFKANVRGLADGLHDLLQTEVIDKRLFAWGEELRKVRNLAAHASADKVSREDAEDVLDFAHAICEYVFVMTERFNSFQERRARTPAKA